MVAGAIIASSSPSAVSWLYFASRLIELPLGLVGVAMGTVLVPELSRAVRGDDRERDRACGIARAGARGRLALPATLGLIVLASPIVRLLFEHGAFTAPTRRDRARADVAVARAARACAVQGAGAGFFARENTTTPLVAALKGIALATRGCLPVRPSVRRRGHCGRHRARRMEQRAVAAARGRHEVRASRSMPPRAATPAAHRRSRRWRWAPLLWLATRSMPLARPARPRAGRRPARPDRAGIAAYGLLLRLFGVIGWREAVNAVRQNRPARLARLDAHVANDAA